MFTTFKKIAGIAIATISVSVAAAFAITSLGNVSAFQTRGDINTYQLVLDDKNAVSSSGTHVQTSKTGGQVEFNYTLASASSGNHVALAVGGTIVNTDVIHSITSFQAVFEGTLQARVSYTTSKWGQYFNLVSGQTVELGSNPYYLELNAVTGVALQSATYGYSCAVNDDAEEQNTEGSYSIAFSSSSDGTAELDDDDIIEQVASGSNYIDSFSDSSKIFVGAEGLKFGSKSASGSVTINFKSSTVSETITSIDVSTAQYGSDTGSFNVYLNGSLSKAATITPSTGGSVSVNAKLTSITFETTTKRAYLVGLTLNYGSHVEPGVPAADEVGFTASDANKDTYTTNSIFDTDNALSVAKMFSDGTTSSLNHGENGYSYQITDPLGVAINTNVKFASEGIYTLVVSYKNYIPVEIQLTVGEYIYIEDVAASMSTTTFNTADVLSNNLTNNLVANVTYSNGTSKSDIAYGAFESNNLGLKLINPKGISHNISNPFGTAGTWSAKVYRLDDENINYSISLTVNAVPVTSITLNETTHTLTVEETLQLTTTVNPTTATNSTIDWSSTNESVATVSENGLVTAVSVGGATISATAADGSGVVATCSIIVNPKPSTTDYSIDATSTSQVTTSSTSTLTFTNSPVTVTIAKSSSNINANNYVASGTSSHTRAYSGQRFTISAGSESMSKIVIHGTSDKGVNGFTSPTWTNATKSYSGNEITLTPTDPDSDVYCTISDTCSFSGVTVTCGTPAAATPVYPTSISVTAASNTISIGETSQLSVAYTPVDTNVKNVTFSSNNESVATVSSTGLVTGVTAGNATITATAEAASGTVSNTVSITVKSISVTSISLDITSVSIKAGKTATLVPTISPSNATNKNVTWTTSSSAVATVSNGVVTGIAAGNATITVKTVDGNKTATCAVTVTASTSGGEETFSIAYTDLPSAYQTSSTIYTAASGVKFQAYNCAGGYSSKIQFKASSGYLQTAEELELQSLTINDRESNSLTVYGSNTAGNFSTVITGTNDVYDLTGYSYFKIAREASGAAYCSGITITTGTPTPTDPTSIALSPSSAEIAPGASKTLSVTYTPSNANQNKDVTWTSSNTNVATVDSIGKVSVKSTATSGQTATITATLTNITSIKATCTITVVAQSKDNHTVLIYMCGSNLESDYASQNDGLATGDITEILSVTGQPDDVNIVIETGGANSWSSKYGISSSKLERWHVEGKQLVKDQSLTYASMGLTSTLQSFVEYGLNTYPADKTGIIFWNHGGAMRGVCYDEKKNDDSLLTNEVSSAISGALSNCSMSGQKLEWVGYDACLMQVQDIASINSDYFNYMIASEESEAGYGWDYDTWVDDLYAKKTTPTILKAIVDGFIKDNGGTSSSSNDQTLSYLNLSYMSAYVTAWNNMATQLGTKLNSGNKSSFNTLVKSAKHYADSDYTYYGIFDAKDFINKLAANSTFNPGSTYTDAVLSAHANLVAYSSCGKGAGNSYGLCLFWSVSSNCSKGTYYTAAMTKFTAWRTLVTTYGS